MLNEKNRYKTLITDIFYLAVIALICYLCYGLFSHMVVSNKHDGYWSDLPYYIRTATDGTIRNHRLVLVLFRVLYGLTGDAEAIKIFLSVEMGLIFFANYFFVKSYSESDTHRPFTRRLIQFFSIAVVFAGPIYVPHFHRAFYKGTFPIFAWHSPTQQMTTLFGVLGTLCLFKMIVDYEDKIGVGWWIGSAVGFFLSAYSKPSYLIDMVPAIVVVFLIDLARKNSLTLGKKFTRLFIIGLSLVPSGIYILILNYIIYQRADRRGDGDIIVDSTKLAGLDHITVAVCCCIAFPLVVMLFNLRKLLNDKRYQIIVISAIVGMLQWLILSESGRRANHGNFSWGTTIGGYMLYLVSMGIVMENLKDREFLWGKKWLKGLYYLMLAGSLGLSLLTQVYYFITMLNGAGYWR